MTETILPNPLSASAVSEARSYYEQGQYMQAWDTLAQAGDRYADNAAAVLGRNQDSADYFFQQMVQLYWGEIQPGAYESNKFNEVAGVHLGNYLNELKQGNYPDTDFIIKSYEQSLSKVGLDKNMAFDGGLARMLPGDTKLDSYWSVLLGMEANRITSSPTTNNLSIGVAGALIGNAMTGALWNVINSGRLANFSASMVQRFGAGVLDYLKDLANISGFTDSTSTGEWVQYGGGYGAVSWVYEVSVAPDPWAWLSSPSKPTGTVTVGPTGPTTIDDTSISPDGSTSDPGANYYDPGFSVDYAASNTPTYSVNVGDLIQDQGYQYYADYYSDNYSCYAYDYYNYGYYGFTGSQSTVTQALGTNIGLIAQQAINDRDFVAAAAANAGHQQAQDAALLAALPNGSGAAVLEAAHWDHQLITWSLAEVQPETAAVFSHALDGDYQADVQQAFATWANASGLKFQQVADSAQSDIRLGFAELDTLNSGVAGYTRFRGLDGAIQSNTLIQLEDPNQLALTTDASGQKIYADTEAEFSQLLLHEIGHALGLGSNADPYSVMYYELTATNRALDNTDVAGIKAIYGEGQTAQASVNASVDQLVQALASFAPPASGQISLPATNDPFINPPLLAVSR